MMRAGFLAREIDGSRATWRATRSLATLRGETRDAGSASSQLRAARPVTDIPGPKALPVLGNWFRFIPYIGEYNNMNSLTLLRTMRERYGDIVKLDSVIPYSRSRVFLFTPELCEEMFRTEGTWPLRISMETMRYYRKSKEELYDTQAYSLIISHGKTWYNFRTKVNPYMLQPRKVQDHVAQLSEVTSDFVERMRALRDPKTLELPDNFLNELYKWALESIWSIALNCRLGCLEPNLDSEPQIMINCVHDMFELFYRLEVLPSLWKMYNTRDLRKLFRILDTLNEITNKYIERAKTKLHGTTDNADPEGHRSGILGKLMHVDEEIACVMAEDMLTAGIDTTGNSVGCLLYYIATNPAKQEKLREEVMSLLPDKTSPVTRDTLNQTKYAKACIKESFRLFPIAPGIVRTAQTDVCIGGYRIPKGYDIFAVNQLMSLEPKQFPRPEEYIPERWLRGNTEFPSAKEAHPFTTMPFGFGPRSCIGQRISLMEMETLLLTVIRNFRIEWHHGPLKYETGFIYRLLSSMRFKLVDV